MEGQCSTPSRCPEPEPLLYPACRNIPVRQLRLPRDQLCGSSQSSSGRVPDLGEKKGPGTLAGLGQASRLPWTGLE